MNTEKTGKLISEIRKEKNLTQSQLADLISVSDKAISRWETGRGFPDIDNLEALAECLGITVAEMIKGERLEDTVSKEEVNDIAGEGLSFVRFILNKKKYANILLGFLLSIVVLTLAIVHLNSPIYITGAKNAIEIEEMSDGRVVAILNEKIAGVDVETIKVPDEEETIVTVGGYTTRLHQILGKENHDLVLLGNKEDIDVVYYYPGTKDGDEVVYNSRDVSEASLITLPRLVYNSWIAIGVALSAVGIAAYLICRKKRYAGTILKIAAVPVAFTVSLLICLMGHFGEIYNAPFYLSGILLLAIVLYVIFLILISRRKITSNASNVI